MSLQGRVSKLEGANFASGRRLLIIERLKHESIQQAEASAGIAPEEADTVIFLTRFALPAFSSQRERQVNVQELRA